MPSDFRYVQDIIVKRVLCMPANKLTLADIRQAVDLTFNHPGRDSIREDVPSRALEMRRQTAKAARAQGPGVACAGQNLGASLLSRPDLYIDTTNKIVADLERGVRPWMRPLGRRNLAGRVTKPYGSTASLTAFRCGLPLRRTNMAAHMDDLQEGTGTRGQRQKIIGCRAI